MSHKSKGINAERELVHMFWKENWACLRIAGSGSIKYPSPDLLAGNNLRKLAVECKTTKSNNKYFEKESILSLNYFAKIFGTESWIAIKFKNKEWLFVSTADLIEKGKSYFVDLKTAERRGLLFEELIRC